MNILSKLIHTGLQKRRGCCTERATAPSFLFVLFHHQLAQISHLVHLFLDLVQ